MTTAPFDTPKLARALREANFSAEQAGGAAYAVAEAVQTDLATKSDLREIEGDLREMELRLDGKIATLGADLRAELAATKADILKWMFGTIGFQTLVTWAPLSP